MRRVRYSVAMSLDGCLAGPKGEIDWITNDPEVDFVGLAAQFDTMVARKTYEFARAHGASVRMPGITPYVLSRTLEQTQGLVDTVEVGIIPVLLGGGVALLPDGSRRAVLRFVRHRLHASTGRMWMEYEVA